jgi:hypothetical protein
MIDDETAKLLESMRQELEYLRGRVNALESNQRMERVGGLPDTWLLSPSLLKRAFGVYGHNLLAGFLIAIPFMCIYLLIVIALIAANGSF